VPRLTRPRPTCTPPQRNVSMRSSARQRRGAAVHDQRGVIPVVACGVAELESTRVGTTIGAGGSTAGSASPTTCGGTPSLSGADAASASGDVTDAGSPDITTGGETFGLDAAEPRTRLPTTHSAPANLVALARRRLSPVHCGPAYLDGSQPPPRLARPPPVRSSKRLSTAARGTNRGRSCDRLSYDPRPCRRLGSSGDSQRLAVAGFLISWLPRCLFCRRDSSCHRPRLGHARSSPQ
jgi:hypothetical protein